MQIHQRKWENSVHAFKKTKTENFQWDVIICEVPDERTMQITPSKDVKKIQVYLQHTLGALRDDFGKTHHPSGYRWPCIKKDVLKWDKLQFRNLKTQGDNNERNAIFRWERKEKYDSRRFRQLECLNIKRLVIIQSRIICKSVYWLLGTHEWRRSYILRLVHLT